MLYQMNKLQKLKIGGEFEINPSFLNSISDYIPNDDVFFYSSGRSALMSILKNVSQTNPKIIHIPYYICPSIVNACVFAGFEVSFYELEEGFLISLDYLEKIKNGESLLTVNYFGFVNDNPLIASINQLRPDIVTISDHSQSFWTYKQSLADYSFTSLRKHFPVPDGAVVHSQKAFAQEFEFSSINSFYPLKLIGSVLKWHKQDDWLYLNLFNEGENVLDKERNPTQASLISKYLFDSIKLEQIKEQRKKNTKVLYEIGQNIGLKFVFDYNEDVIPLSVPVLLNDRDQIRNSMMSENVFLPIHWKIEGYNTKSKFAKRMAFNSLSLIVDQRYMEDDILHQIVTLKIHL